MLSIPSARKQRRVITRGIVIRFLSLLEQGENISKMASTLDLSISAVNSLIRSYNEGKLDDPTIFVSAPEKKRQNRACSDDETIIREEITRKCSITQRELSKHLSVGGRTVSQPTVCRRLKCAGYSWKKLTRVPESRNQAACIESRKEYADIVSEFPDEMFVFLDETGFNLHTCPSRGYSLVGTEARQIVPSSKGRNVSLLCAISVYGVLSFELIAGPYDSVKFCEFIQKKLVPALKNDGLEHVFVIMDNCRVHKTDAVENLFDKHEIAHLFLPPYSPQLNPIEETFSVVKNMYKRLENRPNNVSEIIAAVEKLLEESTIDTAPMYRHTREFLVKAKGRVMF